MLESSFVILQEKPIISFALLSGPVLLKRNYDYNV